MDLEFYRSEFGRLSRLIDEGNAELRRAIKARSVAERDYRKAKAEAWARCPIDPPGTKAGEREWTAERRKDWVAADTAELRYARDDADADRHTAYESLQSRQSQMSSLQSLMAADREEAKFARTGPEMSP